MAREPQSKDEGLLAGDAIRWELVRGRAARATLVEEGAPVAAILEFDAEGESC